eukprot:376764-Pelagomonas_calceolata.AAC.3
MQLRAGPVQSETEKRRPLSPQASSFAYIPYITATASQGRQALCSQGAALYVKAWDASFSHLRHQAFPYPSTAAATMCVYFKGRAKAKNGIWPQPSKPRAINNIHLGDILYAAYHPWMSK